MPRAQTTTDRLVGAPKRKSARRKTASGAAQPIEVVQATRVAGGQALAALRRREQARQAAVARWSRRPQVATAQDAPASVRRVLRRFGPASLVWADPDHRYVIVRESLVRGDSGAVRWLRSVLRPSEIRELVRRNRGTGCSEPERQKLRKKLRLTSTDIPVRPI
jgi:hypothetical protein